MTGGTGLIGQKLGPVLQAKGHDIIVLTRNVGQGRARAPFAADFVEGDLQRGPISSPHLADVQAVVHLMGENVGEGRWTDAKKKSLVDSRVQTTRNLRKSVPGVKHLIASSAIGFYGDRGDEILDESSVAGKGFLADLCVQWEREVQAFREDGVRTVSVRTGLVLSRSGGALPTLAIPFRAGVGGPLAGGKAWMSWIHLDDVVGLYGHALLDTTLEGALNATAPHPVRNEEFTKVLAAELHRPALFPVPALALKLALGEKAEMVLASQNVLPKRAKAAGYPFKYSELREALKAEL